MLSLNYVSTQYILSVPPGFDQEATFLVNGYKLQKPKRYKNLAHERAFEIALVLAQKRPIWSGVTMMTTADCIDVIMFNGDPEIQLKLNAVNPQKVTKDAMKFVASFFDPGLVIFDQRKKGKKLWYLEIKRLIS